MKFMANDNGPKVVDFPGPFYGDLPPDYILEHAQNAKLVDVVVIGRKPNGKYFLGTSTADAYKINWMIDKIKADLMSGCYPGLTGPEPDDATE
jgi:hypothetical protein